jgi:putative thiamine transport system ATP-binding protein
LRRFVFEHARARGLPILLVTHDPDDAQAAGGAILELGRSPDNGPQLVSRGERGG